MNTRIKNRIIELAREKPDVEICGLIYRTPGETHIHECPNRATDEAGGAGEAFRIDPQDYIAAHQKGKIVGVYHSHPKNGSAHFSEADLQMASAVNLPIYLYANKNDTWRSYIPITYKVSLSGRDFAWGMDDCYEAIRIYYRQEKGVYLTDYDRDESFENAGESAITQYVQSELFTEVANVADIQIGDVLLFKTPGGSYPHHLGVLVAPQQMLHHKRGALSSIDPVDGAWLRRLVSIYRRV